MWPQVAGTNTLLDLPSLCLFVLYLCPWCYGCPTSFRALRKGQLSIRCLVWKKKPLIRTFETAADQWNHVNGCKPWFLWGALASHPNSEHWTSLNSSRYVAMVQNIHGFNQPESPWRICLFSSWESLCAATVRVLPHYFAKFIAPRARVRNG